MNLIETELYGQAEMYYDLFNKKGKYFLEFDSYECLTYDLDSLIETFRENYGIDPNKENLMKFAEKFKGTNFILPFTIPKGDSITRGYKVNKENISSEKFSGWYLIEMKFKMGYNPIQKNYIDIFNSGVVVPKLIADNCHTGLLHSPLWSDPTSFSESYDPISFSIKKYKPIQEKMMECSLKI
ncbi:MAG: hypothetical protein KKF74_03740 [Nanoarchaeota archaeon]|nr:hypothetical protein [Nanoarchaeota archaeon]